MVKKVLLIFGTRPEAIKMASIFHTLKNSNLFNVKVCVTGQHKEMLTQVLDLFNINPDYNLNLMQANQTLESLTADILLSLKPILLDFMPDVVLVHGDTTTTMATSLACFYNKIKVAHVEAGLRTNNKYSPWPEEINRKVTATIADFHFCPTVEAKENLLNEGYKKNLYITGNTVIDSLLFIQHKIQNNEKISQSLSQKFNFIDKNKKLILVTGHRRENFGEGILSICNALKGLASRDDVQIVYPVHLNPNIKNPVNEILYECKNVFLLYPQEYLDFVYLMINSYLILTDSGGIQEEASAIGKPILVMRDTTERPEAIKAGIAKLVGTNAKKIVDAVNLLLDESSSASEYARMSKIQNIYGDGTASIQIQNILLENI
ncbi:MAG: hypothetical protein RLZZ210_260 [Pseudomonadota bacterium]|jgi:UDP-N-acetylglucosamine 2-epimerase (non-hydrolysing)